MVHMRDNKLDELPSSLMFDYILERNFMGLTGTILTKEDKEALALRNPSIQDAVDIFDVYTDKMIPAVAGPKLFPEEIRHLETITESELPKKNQRPGDETEGPAKKKKNLRITASTEAFTALLYENNRTKWAATHRYLRDVMHEDGTMAGRKKKGRCMTYPKWNPKEPEKNKEWMTMYTESNGKQNPLGGWNNQGRRRFLELVQKVNKSREENFDRHVREDQASVDRLFDANREKHTARLEKRGMKRKNPVEEEVFDGMDEEWELD